MKKNDNIPLNYKERSQSRISLILSVTVLALLLLLFNQLDYRLIRKPEAEAAKKAQEEKARAEAEAAAPEISTVSVVAVGDNFYQENLLQSGVLDTGERTYDHVYSQIKDEISAADIAIVQQETIFTSSSDSVVGYAPSYATPTEVADALVAAGFDVIEAATNHADDYGSDYISQTLNFWRDKYPDIPVLGIHDSASDAASIRVLEQNGIRIALLDYTYGTNNTVPEGEEYRVDTLEQEKVAADIAQAKENSDCIILTVHWGEMDASVPTEYQKQWAAFFLEQGVDVVLGGNPQVIQPYGTLSDDQGNEMLLYYSLGNFASAQEYTPNLLGGMASFQIQKTVQNGETTIDIVSPDFTPLVMHYNYDTGDYATYLLSDYTEELASQHSMRDIDGEAFSLANLQKSWNDILSQNIAPSTGTNLLAVTFDTEGNMVDASGNIVSSDTSSGEDSSEDSGDGSEDEYYEEDSEYYEEESY